MGDDVLCIRVHTWMARSLLGCASNALDAYSVHEQQL